MTLPLFVADGPLAPVGGSLVLTGDEGRHAATVQRIAVGEQVLVTTYAGEGRWGMGAATAAITAVVAGEYHGVFDTYTGAYDDIPLGRNLTGSAALGRAPVTGEDVGAVSVAAGAHGQRG